ncbi:hypothetical protein TWF718_000375 [Orbilia javanica]|uniref:Nucleoside phosphorylase domain-containing protein n=1 Tax=Orbilia javanica TaxID=47235 RepID=A0AAN8MTT8_9PEZI
MATQPISKPRGEYTVGWICALPKEQVAAISMLDEQHSDLHFSKPPNDANNYTLGSIHQHNVVITCLPLKCYGTNQAARAAAEMFSTFPSIRVVLMVGIGAGIPPKVQLGDVVISTEWVQWDFGKAKDGGFEPIDKRYYPPTELSTAMAKLQVDHDSRGRTMIPDYLKDLESKSPHLKQQYTSIGNPKNAKIHYGLIASGNQVVKYEILRDGINRRFEDNILCIEMEAAGLVGVPAVVIRGICDYADTNKNDDWQEYAAAVAAACAKELLGCIHQSVPREIQICREEFEEATTEIARLRHVLTEDHDRKVLNWITPIDDSPQHNDILNIRQPGTGEWLLNSPEYLTWLNTNKQILFCPGIPGAGKTILASVIIDDLLDRYCYNQTVGIAYIYLNYKNNANLRIDDLLLNILKQLARTRISLPKCIEELYTRYNSSRPSRTEIIKALHKILAEYSRAFLVVDAIDEYGEHPEFLEKIFGLHDRQNLNILATSRPIINIRRRFEEKETYRELQIKASDDDVKAYLEGQILRWGTNAVKLNRQEIKDQITERVQGMFLLANLYFKTIKSATSRKEIRKILEGFGSDGGASNSAYNSTYKDILNRIRQYDDKNLVDRTLQVLLWVTCTTRRLTKEELQHAIAVELDELVFDPDNISTVDDLISPCLGLVIVDEQSNVVRLIHYTAQEYFEVNRRIWFPDSDGDIAKVCIAYLCSDIFKTGPCSSLEVLAERTQSVVLYKYAFDNWGYHVQKAFSDDEFCRKIGGRPEANFLARRVEITELMLRLLLHNDLRLGRLQMGAYFRRGSRPQSIGPRRWLATTFFRRREVYRTSGAHFAAYCGSTLAMEAVLERGLGIERLDNRGRTPLIVAAEEGRDDVVRFLIEREANINAKDWDGSTALMSAASKNRMGIFRLLINAGADLEIKNDTGQTALLTAVSGTRFEFVRALIDQGADRKVRDNRGRGLLATLVDRYSLWDKEDARFLVESFLGWEDQQNYRDIIVASAKYGFEDIIESLIGKGLNLGSSDGVGVLLAALTYGRRRVVVELLLKNGAGFDGFEEATHDCRGWGTLLKEAVIKGMEVVIKSLVEKGAKVDDFLLFEEAGKSEKEETMMLLLDLGLNPISICEGDSNTALHVAAKYGYQNVVRRLIMEAGTIGIDIDAKDGWLRTPLHIAVIFNHPAIVGFLIENGANTEVRDEWDVRPISDAVQGRNKALVELLVRAGADIISPDGSGETPLQIATERRHKGIVKFLTEEIERQLSRLQA